MLIGLLHLFHLCNIHEIITSNENQGYIIDLSQQKYAFLNIVLGLLLLLYVL